MITPKVLLIHSIGFAFLVSSTSFAVAACSLRDVANRTWAINATEVKTGIFTRCKIRINNSGSMIGGTNACKVNTIGIDNFDSSKTRTITTGAIRSVGDCDFQFRMTLSADMPSIEGVVSLSGDKLTAMGVFQNDARGGGHVGMVRQ
jgi:hypothetical protein